MTMRRPTQMETKPYEAPVVRDYGDLRALTAACMGSGSEDGASKDFDNPFVLSSPDFGDPGFCN
jgi:hypothetical protein